MSNDDVVDERAFPKLVKVQCTPTILILDDNDLNEPLERMNGFRPLHNSQETLLFVTRKDEELGFTLENEPNLVKARYFSMNYDLSNFIGQKPKPFLSRIKIVQSVSRCIEKLLPVKKSAKL